jgi:hypothetical protein
MDSLFRSNTRAYKGRAFPLVSLLFVFEGSGILVRTRTYLPVYDHWFAGLISRLRKQGRSWSEICSETGLSKGTAQRAFSGLPKNPLV